MGKIFKRAFAGQTSNQSGEFYNFALPAVGTCIKAPDACRNLVCTNNKGIKKPVCFAIRPVTNWPFTEKVAKMNAGNCIFKQYANLYLTFDKDKTLFMKYLKDVLCPKIKKSFNDYYNQDVKAFNPSGSLYKSYDYNNIWSMLSLYYNNSSQNDFLVNVNNSNTVNGGGLFVNYMIDEITSIINENDPNVDIYFRIHYSGDFYSEEYFKKWIDISDYFNQNVKIHFMAYTKEIENIEIWLKNMGRNLQGGTNDINLKLVFSEMSGFGAKNDTTATAINAYNRLNKSQPLMKYTAVQTIPSGYKGNQCKVNCSKSSCMNCYSAKYTSDVMVKIF